MYLVLEENNKHTIIKKWNNANSMLRAEIHSLCKETNKHIDKLINGEAPIHCYEKHPSKKRTLFRSKANIRLICTEKPNTDITMTAFDIKNFFTHQFLYNPGNSGNPRSVTLGWQCVPHIVISDIVKK